jgi:hypothetical protein
LKYLRIQYIKHHATKAYEGTEVCLHAFWTSRQDLNCQLHSPTALPKKKPPVPIG